MCLNLTYECNQAREELERVKDPGVSACVEDVESRVEDEVASMQEILVDEGAGGESRRVLFGIDLIDHSLQDVDGQYDRHNSVEFGGSKFHWAVDVCRRRDGSSDMQWIEAVVGS